MDRVYNWKNFVDNRYEDFSGEDSDLKLHELSGTESMDSELYSLCKSFIVSYDGLKIPTQIEVKLDELLLEFDLAEQKSSFLVIGCALQLSFSDSFEIEVGGLMKDFDSEFKDFKELLKVLKMYLFADNLKQLPDVTFKTLKEGNFYVKNFFVKWDIYFALCSGFGLNKENFETRSQELLNMTNKSIVDRYPEKVKVDFIQSIFNYLSEKSFNRADALRFIGVFFKFFQIEVNKAKEFLIYDSLELNISSIDIKNLYHYISRPPKLFHY